MGAGGVGIGISVGGTKIATSAVDRALPDRVSPPRRIEWHTDPRFLASSDARGLFTLIASEVRRVLDVESIAAASVTRIGIAWPGPGAYQRGLLQATFLPEFGQARDVRELLRDAFDREGSPALTSIPIVCRLDANARAMGETRLASGGFREGSRTVDGLLLNVATGIAGAVVRNGEVRPSWPGLGENYGQWGRFAYFDGSRGVWGWRPTADGTVPQYGPSERRFTELCGGPALAGRLAACDLSGREIGDGLRSLAGSYPGSSLRDVDAERAVLSDLTSAAQTEQKWACEFIQSAGGEIGAAIRLVRSQFGFGDATFRLVLAGGVGEFFGRPRDDGSTDHFVEAIRKAAGEPVADVRRSRLGLVAELAGAVAGLIEETKT